MRMKTVTPRPRPNAPTSKPFCWERVIFGVYLCLSWYYGTQIDVTLLNRRIVIWLVGRHQ